MSKVNASLSMSLDGYVAGPDPSLEEPLGVGGEELHSWVVPLAVWREPHGREGGEVNASTAVVEERLANVGATVMGRNMFGGGPGPWGDDPWNGWWGDEPPFRHPVFVVTHHPREPLTLGETTFTFVTEGVEPAVRRAQEAAGGKDVAVGGGADVIQQCLAAGLVDELDVSVAPVLLGGGTPLFANLRRGDIELEQLRAVEAPGVTHVKYRVRRSPH